MDRESISSKRKALQINLNPTIFGSFAEIGGGQEVAREFFQAGAASGTIAKTISAYDMQFSDALYGIKKGGRYVSKPRLIKMLETEYNEIIRILKFKKDHDTCFFAFANTVATLNFNKTNTGHGWIGVRFQLTPQSLPNQVILHVNLLENDGLLQQTTLGILGVNLIYACYHFHNRPNDFLRSLMDSLGNDRIEINMVEMSGPELDYVDNRLLSVQLVKNGMTMATMFDRNGTVQQPEEMLYKKNLMLIRGSFRPISYVGFDMLRAGYSMFKQDTDYVKENSIVLCEITLNNLLQEGDFNERDFLQRVDILNGMGQNVMISNFRYFYRLIEYFSSFNIKSIRLVMGVLTLRNVLDPAHYADLKGGILEAFGKLFVQNLKLYVYPAKQNNTDVLLSSDNLPIPTDIKYIFKHLVKNGQIIDIKNVKKEWLHIFSHEVLEMIRTGDENWKKMVPKYISETIVKKKLFGYCN